MSWSLGSEFLIRGAQLIESRLAGELAVANSPESDADVLPGSCRPTRAFDTYAGYLADLLDVLQLAERYVVDKLAASRCGWSSQYVRDRLRDYGIPLPPPWDGSHLQSGNSTSGVHRLIHQMRLTIPQRVENRQTYGPTRSWSRSCASTRTKHQSLATIGPRFNHDPDCPRGEVHQRVRQRRMPWPNGSAHRLIVTDFTRPGTPWGGQRGGVQATEHRYACRITYTRKVLSNTRSPTSVLWLRALCGPIQVWRCRSIRRAWRTSWVC